MVLQEDACLCRLEQSFSLSICSLLPLLGKWGTQITNHSPVRRVAYGFQILQVYKCSSQLLELEQVRESTQCFSFLSLISGKLED